MDETKYLAPAIEPATGSIDAAIENNKGERHIHTIAGAEMPKSPDVYISWPSDRTVPVTLFRNEQKRLNEAEILLLPEEVGAFTRALIQHPIPLPTSYSQTSSTAGETYCLRIASKEAFADFVERLSDTLAVLTRNK